MKELVKKLMNHPKYEREINIDKWNYINKEYYDDWGVAFVWLNTDIEIGVEYNISFDGDNCSAIYCTLMGKDGYMYTNYSDFIH